MSFAFIHTRHSFSRNSSCPWSFKSCNSALCNTGSLLVVCCRSRAMIVVKLLQKGCPNLALKWSTGNRMWKMIMPKSRSYFAWSEWYLGMSACRPVSTLHDIIRVLVIAFWLPWLHAFFPLLTLLLPIFSILSHAPCLCWNSLFQSWTFFWLVYNDPRPLHFFQFWWLQGLRFTMLSGQSLD